ncbi:MAG: Hpt domain-containing protein [Thermodesulfobacteriota bacterium]
MTLPPLDLEAALKTALGKRELLERLVEKYRRAWPQVLDDLKKAGAAGDLADLGRISHRMKSSSGIIAALELADLFGGIEQQAGRGDLEAVRRMIGELPPAADRLLLELEKAGF